MTIRRRLPPDFASVCSGRFR